MLLLLLRKKLSRSFAESYMYLVFIEPQALWWTSTPLSHQEPTHGFHQCTRLWTALNPQVYFLLFPLFPLALTCLNTSLNIFLHKVCFPEDRTALILSLWFSEYLCFSIFVFYNTLQHTWSYLLRLTSLKFSLCVRVILSRTICQSFCALGAAGFALFFVLVGEIKASSASMMDFNDAVHFLQQQGGRVKRIEVMLSLVADIAVDIVRDNFYKKTQCGLCVWLLEDLAVGEVSSIVVSPCKVWQQSSH